MLKSELRKIYLTRQKSLSNEERSDQSFLIAEQFFKSFNLDKIKFLHIFLPIEKNNEIETKFIYEKLWQKHPHVKTLVPRVDFAKNEIENIGFHSLTELVLSKWQISEPGGTEIVESELIDIVLVPLLCFDKKGFRVGYGKGFYDKFLANCREDCLKIGLSYFQPVEEINDNHSQDVRLDYCLTPENIWKF